MGERRSTCHSDSRWCSVARRGRDTGGDCKRPPQELGMSPMSSHPWERDCDLGRMMSDAIIERLVAERNAALNRIERLEAELDRLTRRPFVEANADLIANVMLFLATKKASTWGYWGTID